MNTPPPFCLSNQDRLDWLRLIRTERVGPITFWRLLERYGSAGAALGMLPKLVQRSGGQPVAIPSAAVAEKELAALHRQGARLVARGEAGYPLLLAAIDDAPPLLSIKGEAALAARPAIAMVGSRNASLTGRKIARRLAADLAAAGFVVVSGLARGIDTAAHEGALAAGTIAVIAGGIDVVYPKENAALHAAIGEGGLILAEGSPGAAPQARDFPRRNRIIAGAAEAVVVVEANLQSGSLITARLALEQGREVFAVPGSPLDPRAQGPNNLIRQGATLTETADDVLRSLRGALARPAAVPALAPPPFEPPVDEGDEARTAALITPLLSPTPVAVDDIVRASGATSAMVAAVLLDWELAGRIERHPGNRVCWRAGA